MGSRFGSCQLDFADFRGADLTDAALDTAESIRGADFSGSQGLDLNAASLLSREAQELDWLNPLTRSNTRNSLG